MLFDKHLSSFFPRQATLETGANIVKQYKFVEERHEMIRKKIVINIFMCLNNQSNLFLYEIIFIFISKITNKSQLSTLTNLILHLALSDNWIRLGYFQGVNNIF